uniref:Nucleoporin Nup133/Nup155-like N-terminal domain-containing protein n=1 Tax=Dunaliella tertiolecta TaxID=3047 RepID=A0A7S3VQF7_DUNTE|mmetsp:Transcript_14154/g.38319  ORF Transcript_14154/g.38319 Transcript_14154/m.38319 type:complete len:1246 (+) Transcript_14154:187-3924(+)
MLWGSTLSSNPLPLHITARLQQHGSTEAAAGISHSGFCWVIDGRELLLWRQGETARIRSLLLPSGTPNQKHFVAVLTHPSSSTTTVITCSEAGLLTYWLDANHSVEPVHHQVIVGVDQRNPAGQPQQRTVVTAFTADIPELGASAGGPSFVGMMGSVDGNLFFIQGSPQGIFTKQLAALPSQQTRGVLGTLGSVLSWTYHEAFLPGAKFIKHVSSGATPVAVHVAMDDTVNHLHVYVLTANALECWLVTLGMRPREQLLWSFQSLLAAQGEAHLHAPANASFSVVGSHAYLLVLDKEQNGNTTAYIHKLEVKADAHPLHKYCLPVLGTGSLPPAASGPGHPWEGYQLHASPSIEDAVLLMAPGRRLYEWTARSVPQRQQQLQWQQVEPQPALLLSDDPDTLAVAAVMRRSTHTGAVAELQGSTAAGAKQRRSSGASAMDEDEEEAEALGLAGPLDDGSRLQEGAVWLVMNATYGLLQAGLMSGDEAASKQAAPDQAAQAYGPLTAEQQMHIHQLLDSLINQAAAVQAQQQPLMGLAAGLRKRLHNLGALASSDNMQVFASYSTGLVDMMPKQWALGGLSSTGGGSIAGGLMAQLLAEKEAKHALLLQCLGDGGMLHSLPKDVLRVILENAEKLAVASSVLALHMQVQAEQREAEGMEGYEPLIIQVIHAAGLLTTVSASEPLPPQELFYARPSASIPRLLQALGSAGAQVADQASSGLSRPGDEGARTLIQHTHDLGKLLGAAVAAAHAQRDSMQIAQHVSSAHVCTQLGNPGWLANQSARQALDQLALACQAVRALLLGSPNHPSTTDPLSLMLSQESDLDARTLGTAPALLELALTTFGVVEVLLAGFAAAVAATQQADAKSELLGEYRAARGRCCRTLLADAVLEVQARESAAGVEGMPASDCLIWQVEELAAAHHCFPQLFDASQVLQARDVERGGAATARFHQHMMALGAEEGAAETETFARYCYQRLLDDARPADVLLLPPAFYADLRQFLEERPQHAGLLWPLLLRAGDWSGGAGALALDARAHMAAFPKHNRLLCLSQLSHTAAGEAAATQATSAELQLLSVQSRLHKLAMALELTPPGGSPDLAQVLDVPALVDTALATDASAPAEAKGRAATLALEALAVCPQDVREANRSKFKLSWRHAVEATPWDFLASQLSVAEQAEDWEQAVQQTPVYQAAHVCCGHGAFGFGPSVRDTAPVLEVEGWIGMEWVTKSPGKDLALQAFNLAILQYDAQQREV